MGNWRTVTITGTCDPAEVPALRRAVDMGTGPFGPLTFTRALAGLPNWPAARIDATGNLAERGYDPADVAEHLGTLGAVAPSLRVRVHCGGDYEAKACVATVTLDGDGARVGPPEVEAVEEIRPGQMMAAFLAQTRRPS